MTPIRSLCCFLLLAALMNDAFGDEPFKNATAREAQAAYKAAIAKAKAAYVQALDKAAKEAGGAGRLDEANRIAAEKKKVESDQGASGRDTDLAAQLRNKIEGTLWVPGPNRWTRFKSNGNAVNKIGTIGRPPPLHWFHRVTEPRISMSGNSTRI